MVGIFHFESEFKEDDKVCMTIKTRVATELSSPISEEIKQEANLRAKEALEDIYKAALRVGEKIPGHKQQFLAEGNITCCDAICVKFTIIDCIEQIKDMSEHTRPHLTIR